MATSINMVNKHTGISKTGLYGFSWTTFLFGPFPALFRADFLTFISYFVISIIIGAFTAGIGVLVMSIVWAFFYNGFYTKKLLEKGYTFKDSPENVRAAIAALDLDSSKYQPSEPVETTRAKARPFSGEASLSNDAYKLWLVKQYSVEKNAALDKFVANEKLFATVDDALVYLDGLEKEIVTTQARKDEASRQSELLSAIVVEKGSIANTQWTYRLYKDGAVVTVDPSGGEYRYESMAKAKASITWWN